MAKDFIAHEQNKSDGQKTVETNGNGVG